jgi:hypothetical protein
MAGGGHEHDSDGGHSHGPISNDNVINRALKKVKQMAHAGKIDATWSAVKTARAEQKTFSKGPEWVVTFKNDKVSDTAKQTLYLFFSLDGHYIAANYTGN